MKDKELRKLIGSRAKQRRLELNLTQPYVAEKMGVTASTILRYENGSIDNTKKMVLEGLSEALHVSIEWLKGETDEYETDITDKKELQIRDAMGDILKKLPLDLSKKEDAFSKDLLLLMLKQDVYKRQARTSSRVALLPIRIFSSTLSRVRKVF